MLSKEEIEKAKERISKSLNDGLFSTLYSQEENEEDEKILLAYIKQLETKLENIYWQGYIQKQNEAMEICKQCKYIKKAKKLETDKQKLIEKLEECAESYYTLNEDEEYERNKDVEEFAKEILKILKGEKE